MPGFKLGKFHNEMRLLRSLKAAEVPDARKITQYVKSMTFFKKKLGLRYSESKEKVSKILKNKIEKIC